MHGIGQATYIFKFLELSAEGIGLPKYRFQGTTLVTPGLYMYHALLSIDLFWYLAMFNEITVADC